MQTLVQDIRFGVRQVRHNPGQYALIILILALGIGANCAIFSKLNQALLRPLPCQNPDRVVQISTLTPEVPFPGVSYLDLQDFKAQNRVFEQIGAWSYENPMILRDAGEPVQVGILRVTPELLEAFGIKPLLGREIKPSDCQNETAKVILIPYQLWKGQFNGG
jgi:hypothetical protein